MAMLESRLHPRDLLQGFIKLMIDAPQIIQNSNGVWMLSGEQLWDTTILPVCLEHIKEGDTVIDAGAWIGGHTMAYAEKVGENGRVVAMEPNPYAFGCLKKNTSRFPNVIRIPMAVGNEFGPVCLSVRKGWADSAYVVAPCESDVGAVMATLDDYIFAPNFIKIDVEGCELKVLNGAEKTIEKHKPVMCIEINQPALQRQGDDKSQVLGWLLKHGYVMHSIEKDVTTDTPIYNILAFPA